MLHILSVPQSQDQAFWLPCVTLVALLLIGYRLQEKIDQYNALIIETVTEVEQKFEGVIAIPRNPYLPADTLQIKMVRSLLGLRSCILHFRLNGAHCRKRVPRKLFDQIKAGMTVKIDYCIGRSGKAYIKKISL